MKKELKKAGRFVLTILPIALVGGFFTGIYGFAAFTPDMQSLILEQVGSREVYYIIAAVQTAGYGVVLGGLGYLLSQKIGLLKPFRLEQKPLVITLLFALVCGAVLSTDTLFFGGVIPQVGQLYEQKPSLAYWIASILYGGVIEEVMMRLFCMSLLSFLLWKVFFRKQEQVPVGVLIASNVIAALLFAAGHLPATLQMFGEITPLILFRCFLLNSFGGLCFGYLYRKHGIQYAMLAHGSAHIVWKVIWVLFI